MAVKRGGRARRSGGSSKKESEFEARLAPPEEKSGAVGNRAAGKRAAGDTGRLPVDTGKLKLPQDLIEEGQETASVWRIDPVVFAILCLSLLFIAAIAYVIWQGWELPVR
ncbi:MAG TPA: hypothetical protein VGC64_07360 [Pyrinomonadaceae bacterium]